ncbi:MAG: dTDP-glucose 4,6-dehydratase [Candidatus Marinimicrobia bacterium]|nr:dTDP-glucose 4,6-dehydratase [Candidatus Neomarinimicrobiota bacterium]|tara:strand:- start:8869 stop:9942 length:1074 start_codon:yes stop_codon:yes gene_type:complete
MNSKKENIILTGGYGFIGSHLVKSLIKKQNHNIINIDNLSYSSNLKTLQSIDEACYEHLNIDIGEFNEFETIFNKYNPVKVFHLAAESHVDRSIDGPDIFVKTNILGTFNILDGLRKHLNGLPSSKRDNIRLIHISTDEVYGSIKKGKSSENDNLRPNSPYSSSKASSDLIVRAWNRTYNLPVVTTRCTNNYGPWQFPEKLIPLVVNKIMNNKKIPVYGTGEQIRDWIHVKDHVEALIALSESSINISGEIYNIGSENQISNLDLVKKICKICDNEIPPKKGSYLDLISFVDDRPGHDYRYALDTKKIISDIDWSPKFTFDNGLKNTITWYIENHSSLSSYFKSDYDGGRIGLGKEI